jgi:carbamoylphosphate synthase small subunit
MSYTFYFPKPDYLTTAMFIKHGYRITANPMEVYDATVYTGGADVSPFLYGEKALPRTQTDMKRDRDEIKQFREDGMDFPKVGICRGAQFLNVMHGGAMWQHVNNHGQPHQIMDENTGEHLTVSSTHHQMMIPGEEGVVCAFAAKSTERIREAGIWRCNGDGEFTDPEVIVYPNYNTVCFQPHPEYDGYAECTDYFFDYVKRVIIADVDKQRAYKARVTKGAPF